MLYKAALGILGSIMLFSLTLAYAIDAPKEFSALENSAGEIQLQWSKPTGALYYTVLYGNKPYTTGNYTKQTDFIEGNTLVLKDIKQGDTTYFSIVAIDENGNESVFSEEINVTLGEEKEDFILASAKAIGENKIHLVFTQPLETLTGSVREVSIYSKNTKQPIDTTKIYVDNTDPTKAIVELEEVLLEDIEYEVAVIAIINAEGKSIVSGIDSLQNFFYVKADIKPEVIEEDIEPTNLEAAAEATNAGVNINSEEVDKQLSNVVAKSEKLPKTGPEIILLFLLTLVLSGLVYIFKYKKTKIK